MGVCLSAATKSETTPPSGTSLPEMSIDHSPGREDQILQSSNLKSFSFSDLQMITRNFRTDSAVEEGGFGSVFKGWLDENSLAATKPGTGMAVAVKKLHQTYHGHKEWLAEVNYLGQFSHPNLVRLIGYCLEDDQRLLVYEFVPRGSLENHLFRRGSYFQPICWSLRLKVALGAAKGLAFLHSSEAQIICRDFKTSNILLDLDYNAKLSDYGMARDGVMGDSKSHGSLLGTYGYAAPEDLANGCRTSKSDVYSFGVILLELMSGRRAIDKNRPGGEHKLVEWAKPYLANERKVVRIMDNRLEGQYRVEAVQKVAGLALLCVSLEPKLRLRMDDVVRELEQLQEHMNDTVVRGKSRHRRRSAGDVAGIKVIAAAAAAAANNTMPSIDFKQR